MRRATPLHVLAAALVLLTASPAMAADQVAPQGIFVTHEEQIELQELPRVEAAPVAPTAAIRAPRLETQAAEAWHGAWLAAGSVAGGLAGVGVQALMQPGVTPYAGLLGGSFAAFGAYALWTQYAAYAHAKPPAFAHAPGPVAPRVAAGHPDPALRP